MHFQVMVMNRYLNEIMQIEKPDAILHFTDPRYWTWLYNIEHEVRQKIPIMYYNIWDDVPYPHWNESYYESCDLLMNISRQTQNIVKNVITENSKRRLGSTMGTSWCESATIFSNNR
jgi:hypothetical protein